MEIQELRVFTSIIDEGGFKNAAKALGLTQPAISQSLANLERKLGEKLVNRSSPIGPTPIGRELLKHSRYMLESERDFITQLGRMKQGHLKSISIACDHLASKYYCSDLIGEFHRFYPEANIKVHRLPAREIVTVIQSKRYDIGIGPFQKNMEGLQKIPILKAESVLVAGKKNPYIKLYKKDPLLFLSENILLTSFLDDPRNRPSRKKIRSFFKHLWEVDDINLQLDLVSKGIGLTFIAKRFLDLEEHRKRLVLIEDVPFSTIKKEYGIYYSKQNSNKEIVNDLLNAIEVIQGQLKY
jgi:DNA-binding transcriptional LysR family regulator